MILCRAEALRLILLYLQTINQKHNNSDNMTDQLNMQASTYRI